MLGRALRASRSKASRRWRRRRIWQGRQGRRRKGRVGFNRQPHLHRAPLADVLLAELLEAHLLLARPLRQRGVPMASLRALKGRPRSRRWLLARPQRLGWWLVGWGGGVCIRGHHRARRLQLSLPRVGSRRHRLYLPRPRRSQRERVPPRILPPRIVPPRIVPPRIVRPRIVPPQGVCPHRRPVETPRVSSQRRRQERGHRQKDRQQRQRLQRLQRMKRQRMQRLQRQRQRMLR